MLKIILVFKIRVIQDGDVDGSGGGGDYDDL
jgi:hypothetical protein